MVSLAVRGLAAAAFVVAAVMGGRFLEGDRTSQNVEARAEMLVAQDTYRLQAAGNPATCAVTKGEQLNADLSQLVVDPSCEKVMPGLAKMKFWMEGNDGSVAFTADGIDPLVTFSVADGVAYESFQPRTPVIWLAAVE